MSDERRPLDYSANLAPRRARVWGMSARVWLLLAGFCAFVEFAGSFATGGRIGGWADRAFIAAVAAVGLVALINALRAVRRSGR